MSVAGSSEPGARARILETASHLMTRYGVADTSLKDIQAEARVSASQIYHYFGDKNGLVRAVLAYRKDSVLDLQLTLLSDVHSIEDLRRWAADVIAQQTRMGFRGGCPIGSLSYELSRTDDQVADTVATAFRAWTDALSAGLRSLVSEGVLPPSLDVTATATTLLAAVQGGLLLGQVDHEGQALRIALNTMINLLDVAATASASGTATVIIPG